MVELRKAKKAEEEKAVIGRGNIDKLEHRVADIESFLKTFGYKGPYKVGRKIDEIYVRPPRNMSDEQYAKWMEEKKKRNAARG